MKLNMDLSKLTIPEEAVEESAKKAELAAKTTRNLSSQRGSMFMNHSEQGSPARGKRSKTLASSKANLNQSMSSNQFMKSSVIPRPADLSSLMEVPMSKAPSDIVSWKNSFPDKIKA